MSDVTTEQLKKEISEILKDADLASMSTKKVREQLEVKFKCDLNSRRGEIKDIVMDIVNSKESNDEDASASEASEEEEEDDDEEEDEEEEEAPKSKKRASTGRKAAPPKKKKKASSEEENSEADGDSDDAGSDYEQRPKKGAAKGKKKGGRRKKGSDSDSDEDWKQPKKAQKAKAAGGGGGKRKGTGFTRPYQLSTDLASVVGAESLPRYEVVKKIWALIKERNLYDPKNKQYAICDTELLKVFGVKRFRTFSMLKYLKPHFID